MTQIPRPQNPMYEPTSNLGEEEYGRCGLCGYEGKLSKTHVPPKAVFNKDRSSKAAYVNQPDGTKARVLRTAHAGGGVWRYLLCKNCNNRLGGYDDEWKLFAYAIAGKAKEEGTPRAGEPCAILLQSARPGALVRSFLGCFFAINPTLRVRYPALAAAVRSGLPVVPPPGLHLLLSMYYGTESAVQNACERFRGGVDLRPRSIEGEIVWYPLHLAMVGEHERDLWPEAMTITQWVKDWPSTRREVCITCGVLRPEDTFGSAVGHAH